MGLRIVILAFALLVAGPARADAVAWRNGWWFDGAAFRFGTRYSVDGRFSAGRPAKVDRTVELAHRWVVPAYGDAHHHGIDSADGVEDKATVFLEAGVFYVKNPNAIAALLTPAVRARLGRLSMSVAFGGLTVPGGHPEPLHRYLAGLGVFPGLGPDDLEDRARRPGDDRPGDRGEHERAHLEQHLDADPALAALAERPQPLFERRPSIGSG